MTDDDDAEKAKKLGMQRAVNNAGSKWRLAVYLGVAKLPKGWKGTFEDIRLELTTKFGVPQPPNHHNAWGGISHGLLKAGLIRDTGQRCNMRTTKSHARNTPIYCRP